MPYTKLNVHQRRTIADASRLIFDAGFREKGRLLDDLVERGTIFIDPSVSAGGAFAKDHEIHVSDSLKLSGGAPEAPLSTTSWEFLALAALLVSLSDQAMGHTRLEAWGDALRFCQALQRRIAELYGGEDAAKREQIVGWGHALEEWAKRKRDEAVSEEPPKKTPVHKSMVKVELKISMPEIGIEFTQPAQAMAVPEDYFDDPPVADEPLRKEVTRA